MHVVKIILSQLAPILLAIIGAMSWTGSSTSRLLALVFWAGAVVIALVIATADVSEFRQKEAQRHRHEIVRERLTKFVHEALGAGRSIEYRVRDDPDQLNNFEQHRLAMESWRKDVSDTLERELPNTAVASRFLDADGDYGVGPLRYELSILRRQRQNLASIFNAVDSYIERSGVTK